MIGEGALRQQDCGGEGFDQAAKCREEGPDHDRPDQQRDDQQHTTKLAVRVGVEPLICPTDHAPDQDGRVGHAVPQPARLSHRGIEKHRGNKDHGALSSAACRRDQPFGPGRPNRIAVSDHGKSRVQI